ncbi:helix-turn-helix domain-containing protein [Angustibacter sp. McL0619]|uniref:helix-turn-helix domain-containing protein n=1 Tax=Angustibacter sp. McL0619 TaxID=3415676 RepID=UPI003CEB45BE
MSGQDHGESAASIGAALKQAREARGMTEVEVGAAINLRATLVRAIERDDFALCGGDVYARGHLRAYAKQVGLDAAPLLTAFSEQHATTGPTSPGRAHSPVSAPTQGAVERPDDVLASPVAVPDGSGSANATEHPPRVVKGPVAPLPARRGAKDVPLERSRPNPALLIGAALAALMIFLVVQVVGDLRSPGRGTSQVASPSQTVTSAPAGQPSTTAEPSTPSTGPGTGATTRPTAEPSGVAVALKFTGDSWVLVRDAAGKQMFSGLLGKGDKRRFSDGKGLRLTLGNAGAVRLTVNGKSIGSPGGDGQVVRLKFGPKDPA